MKLKQSLLALLATATVAGAAHADMSLINNDQGSLDFYSIIDVAVVTQDHSLSISPSMPNDIYPFQAQSNGVGNPGGVGATHSVTGLLGGGLSDSRVGFKGGLNMEQGTKAIFNVETGFNPVSGQINNAAGAVAANPVIKGQHGSGNSSVNADSSLNGQLFNRAAFFGFENKNWGKVTFGLQNNPMKDLFGSYDPVASDSFSPFGESGAYGGGGGVSEDARMENSVRYQYTNSGFLFDAAYQFGNNTSSNGVIGGSGVGDGYAFRLGYEASDFGVQFSYDNFTDALKAVNAWSNVAANTTYAINGSNVLANTFAPGQIGLVAVNTDSWVLAGKYTGIKNLNLKLGYESFTIGAPSDTQYNISSIWGTPVQFVQPGFAPGVSQTTNIWFGGGDYSFDPRWNLSLGYYNASIGNSTGSNNSGTIATFSGILTYHLYKNADLYLVGTTNHFSGAAFENAQGQMLFWSDVTAYGAGARVKF